MDFTQASKKDIGNYGEKAAITYLLRNGFDLIDRNVARKTGEIDVVVQKGDALHFVEVKTVLCKEFPNERLSKVYDPSVNLHALKIRKVARTSEWYMAEVGWEGDCQIDGVLVWIREYDGVARVRYLPQIL